MPPANKVAEQIGVSRVLGTATRLALDAPMRSAKYKQRGQEICSIPC